jgi:hypothetical protein
MQNAKDVCYPDIGVKIEIDLKQEYMEFRHNGKPFILDNIVNLIT